MRGDGTVLNTPTPKTTLYNVNRNQWKPTDMMFILARPTLWANNSTTPRPCYTGFSHLSRRTGHYPHGKLRGPTVLEIKLVSPTFTRDCLNKLICRNVYIIKREPDGVKKKEGWLKPHIVGFKREREWEKKKIGGEGWGVGWGKMFWLMTLSAYFYLRLFMEIW